MAKFEFVELLVNWFYGSTTFKFMWDSGNSSKSAIKHGVSCEEVESVFELHDAVPLGIQISPIVEEERYCIVGLSKAGRVLSIVFALRNNIIRPISCRPASKKEREIYDKVRKTIEAV